MASRPSVPKSPSPASEPARLHDLALRRGSGGEYHQTAEGGAPTMTTAQGGPVADDQNTLKVGQRGPLLMEDFQFREKLFHFDHERIPERVVHARGYGAHGYFETYDSLAQLRAVLFKAHPHMQAIDAIHPGDPADIQKLAGVGGFPRKSALDPVIDDFYLTNPIARASAVMAECSALAEGVGTRTAAE